MRRFLTIHMTGTILRAMDQLHSRKVCDQGLAPSTVDRLAGASSTWRLGYQQIVDALREQNDEMIGNQFTGVAYHNVAGSHMHFVGVIKDFIYYNRTPSP
jgi:hypothetical protein